MVSARGVPARRKIINMEVHDGIEAHGA